jgi:hypothetical protein
MMNDTYSGGPSADNFGVDGPPPVLPREDEERQGREIPAYGGAAPRERHRPPSYVRWIAGLLIVFVALALACGGIGAVLAAISFNSTPASATTDKSFSVTGVPTLVIDSAAGNVHITPGTDGQITVHATKRVRGLSHSQAQSALDAITISMTQSGNQVNIQEDNRDDGWFFNGFQRAQIELTVTAPANTNLDVTENAGSLAASGFTGKLMTRVNAGSATLTGMTMAKGSSLSVNAGHLTVDGALQPGASLFMEVNAGSADVTLPQDTSAHLDASASAGSVHVNGWNIAVNHDAANTVASGDLNPNPTGTITIRVSAGSVSLNAGG